MGYIVFWAPLSLEFSREEHWSGLPFPSPGGLPDPGIKPSLPYCRQILYHVRHHKFEIYIHFQMSQENYKWWAWAIAPWCCWVEKDYKCPLCTSLCLLRQCFKRIVSAKYLRCSPEVLILTIPRSKVCRLYLEPNWMSISEVKGFNKGAWYGTLRHIELQKSLCKHQTS